MLVLGDPRTLLHRTVELLNGKSTPAYESPERLRTVIEAVKADGNHEYREVGSSSRDRESVIPGGEENDDAGQLSQFVQETHDAGYLKYLQTVHSEWVELGLISEDENVLPECYRLPSVARAGREPREPRDPSARPGYYSFDMSAGISRDSWSSIIASAGLAAEAVRALFSDEGAGSRRDVMALCRPPGHHCTTKMAGGYCYINNAVVAVQALRHFHRDSSSEDMKVAILDIDFHHGNGTQDYFYHDPHVVYVSVHGEDQYPYYTGYEDETGTGDGEGSNWNLPLPVGSSAEEYLERLGQAVSILEDVRPQYLVVSLGLDTYHGDPLGYFGIHTNDYGRIARAIRGRGCLKDVPAVILLEGGYVVEALGHNLLSFLRGWEDTKAETS
ncbi:hypothetical protein VUR80DRAFT_10167 [Thermomyces stellatus]